MTDDAARLALLLDKGEIIDVTIRYCTALDTKDWGLLATCFTTDAEATYERPGSTGDGPYVGYAAIEERLSTSMNQLLVTQHAVANHVVRVDGDDADCSCYLRAQHVRSGPEGKEQFMVGGSYSDRMVRTDAGWRIHRRSMTYTWTDGGWTPVP